MRIRGAGGSGMEKIRIRDKHPGSVTLQKRLKEHDAEKQLEIETTRLRSRQDTYIEFYLFLYVIPHCFICRPSDSAASEKAGIEPKTVAT